MVNRRWACRECGAEPYEECYDGCECNYCIDSKERENKVLTELEDFASDN